MDDKSRRLLVEAASPIRRMWISTIPTTQHCACRIIMLLQDSPTGYSRPPEPATASGATTDESRHDELCLTRPRDTIGRHDVVVRTIGRYLASDHSTRVGIEPHTQERRRHNDIQERSAFPWQGNDPLRHQGDLPTGSKVAQDDEQSVCRDRTGHPRRQTVYQASRDSGKARCKRPPAVNSGLQAPGLLQGRSHVQRNSR